MFLCIGLCCTMLSFAEDKNLDLVQGDIEITPQGYSQGGNSESGSFTYVITSSTPTSNSTFSTIEGYEYVTIDVSEGDVRITEDGYTVGDVFTQCSGPYILTTSSTTTNALEIVGGSKDKPLVIALDNLNIDLSNVRRDNGQNNNGMNIVSGYVNMILIGENNICGGHDSAGIWLPAEATLRISGDGKLVAKGGSTKTGSWIAGAGIGGAVSSTSVGTLIIDSGSVYGYGALGSAGFGS